MAVTRIEFGESSQPGEVTLITVEDRVASQDAATRAEDAAVRAEAAEGTFTAPANDVVATMVTNAGPTKTALDGKIAAAIESETSRAETAYVPALPPLRKWFSALANRNATRAQVLVLSDSTGEGKAASALSKRWINRLQDGLRSKFPVAGVTGGFGYYPAYYQQDPYVSFALDAGSWTKVTNVGLGRRGATTIAGTPAPLTLTFTGTSFRVFYTATPTSRALTVVIDGGAVTTIPTVDASIPSGGARGGAVWNSPQLTAGSHTISISASGTGTAFFEGVQVFNGDEGSGIQVIDACHAGYRAMDLAITASNWSLDPIATVAPSLILIHLGLNDTQSRTPAQYKAELLDLIAKAKAKAATSPSVLLVIPYERPSMPMAPWADYLTVLNEIAAADTSIDLLSLSARMPIASDSTLGLYAGDSLHLSDAGHQYIADIILAAISPR